MISFSNVIESAYGKRAERYIDPQYQNGWTLCLKGWVSKAIYPLYLHNQTTSMSKNVVILFRNQMNFSQDTRKVVKYLIKFGNFRSKFNVYIFWFKIQQGSTIYL